MFNNKLLVLLIFLGAYSVQAEILFKNDLFSDVTISQYLGDLKAPYDQVIASKAPAVSLYSSMSSMSLKKKGLFHKTHQLSPEILKAARNLERDGRKITITALEKDGNVSFELVGEDGSIIFVP